MHRRVCHVLLLAALWTPPGILLSADVPQRTAIRDTYLWRECPLSRQQPVDATGAFRLQRVFLNGDAEIIDHLDPEQPVIRVVKPMPLRLKPGERVPWIVLGESSWRKQSATIRVLEVKCETVIQPESPP